MWKFIEDASVSHSMQQIPWLQSKTLQRRTIVSKNTKVCYDRCEKPLKTTKNHPLEVAKNVWKRIPHLMQQHETPRKGFN